MPTPDAQDITDMEQQMADYIALCACVPAFPNSLHPDLLDAMRRGDKKEFTALLTRAFWILAHWGLDHPQSRELWKQILTDYKKEKP